jgi:hypothetical protein
VGLVSWFGREKAKGCVESRPWEDMQGLLIAGLQSAREGVPGCGRG